MPRDFFLLLRAGRNIIVKMLLIDAHIVDDTRFEAIDLS